MGRTVGRCVDDTSLGAAQEHLLAADDEVEASVSGNDVVPPPIERQSVRCSVRTVSEYTSLSWSRQRRESRDLSRMDRRSGSGTVCIRAWGMYERGQTVSPSLVNSRSAESWITVVAASRNAMS